MTGSHHYVHTKLDFNKQWLSPWTDVGHNTFQRYFYGEQSRLLGSGAV
jgi:hypothetical protein